jgi:hypothetical protein
LLTEDIETLDNLLDSDRPPEQDEGDLRILSSLLVSWSEESLVRYYFPAVLRIRIRDPMSFWPLVPGLIKKSGYGSGMNNPDHVSESFEIIF